MPTSPHLIVFIARSLDGYIAGKNGELDWLETVPNPAGDYMGYNQLMSEVDAIVMGRTTYETVLGFGIDWPYPKPVFVLSTTLKKVPEELAGKVFLLRGSPGNVLARIQEQGYQRLYIDGGRTIQDFLRADLVNEMRITTIPVLLGGGFPLFGELAEPVKWQYVRTEVFLGEVVQSWYRRAGNL